MRNLKSLFLLLSIVALLASGCKKDDHSEDIKITFVSPKDGDALDNKNNVKIEIRFESEHELHEIEIEMYAHGAENFKLIDEDLHVHEKEYSFHHELDLSQFPAGTHFHLNATVCEDHDCKETHKSGIEFSVR